MNIKTEFKSLLEAPLQELLDEETQASNQPVPSSIHDEIKLFQEAYHNRYGFGIPLGKKTAIVLLMAHGLKGFKQETRLLEEAAAVNA